MPVQKKPIRSPVASGNYTATLVQSAVIRVTKPTDTSTVEVMPLRS